MYSVRSGGILRDTRAFLTDMRAYHAGPNATKRDEIAARQAWLINQHLRPNDNDLQTNDVHGMFERMKDLL